MKNAIAFFMCADYASRRLERPLYLEIRSPASVIMSLPRPANSRISVYISHIIPIKKQLFFDGNRVIIRHHKEGGDFHGKAEADVWC